MTPNARWWLDGALLVASVLALTVGAALYWAGYPQPAHWSWAAGGLLMAAVLLVESAIRAWQRDIGVDLIALLAIAGALLPDRALIPRVGRINYTQINHLANKIFSRGDSRQGENRRTIDGRNKNMLRYNNTICQGYLFLFTPAWLERHCSMTSRIVILGSRGGYKWQDDSQPAC